MSFIKAITCLKQNLRLFHSAPQRNLLFGSDLKKRQITSKSYSCRSVSHLCRHTIGMQMVHKSGSAHHTHLQNYLDASSKG